MDFDQLLQKPNIDPFDSNTQRIRRNLIVTSILGIILAFSSASFNGSQNSFAGFKLENFKIIHVYILLLVELIYFLSHFVWAAFDNFKENKLRLTGIKIPRARVSTNMAPPTFEPNTDEGRQSTLFSWWKGHRNQFEQFEQIIKSIDKNVEDGQLTLAINTSKQKIEEMHSKTLFIEHTLLKFEKGFWEHLRSQILRWFIFDFGIPCLLALASISSILVPISKYICP